MQAVPFDQALGAGAGCRYFGNEEALDGDDARAGGGVAAKRGGLPLDGRVEGRKACGRGGVASASAAWWLCVGEWCVCVCEVGGWVGGCGWVVCVCEGWGGGGGGGAAWT